MCAGLKNGSQRGLVEMAVTKHLTVLQALLDWQAQSKHQSHDEVLSTWTTGFLFTPHNTGAVL